MIIAQLRGPARELARSKTPQELYNGGVFNGIQLDPVSCLLQGLSHRFAPLDDESRLRAAQKLLIFSRRPHETIDALITRFELVRNRARQEGGGAQVSTETASLLLLRACNCTSVTKTHAGSVADTISPDASPAPVPTSPPNHHSPSVGDRLSTFAEGSNEHGSQSEEAMVTLEDLTHMFGYVPESQASDLAEAYVSLTQALQQHEDQPQSTRDEVNVQQLVRASEAQIPSWPQVSYLVHDYKLTTDTQFSESLSSANMFADHEPESDERGAYVAIDAYGHMSKLLPDLERVPEVGEHAEIRIYNTHTKKTIVQRDDDILTPEEELEHSQKVVQAILDELKTWQGFQCFERQKRSEARNVIDVRWVFKWKIKQGKRFIRARLCIRGFKDTGSDQDVNTSPTATRFSQRLLVSETAARRWSLASTDIPKAFLQGISYAELAKGTGREERQVSFELSGQPIFCLRQLPGFSDFNPASEVLRCTKPGTGCKDAPRAFNLKLKRVTAAFGFKPSIMDSGLELWHSSKGELSMLLLKHVDDLKISGHKDDIEKLIRINPASCKRVWQIGSRMQQFYLLWGKTSTEPRWQHLSGSNEFHLCHSRNATATRTQGSGCVARGSSQTVFELADDCCIRVVDQT